MPLPGVDINLSLLWTEQMGLKMNKFCKDRRSQTVAKPNMAAHMLNSQEGFGEGDESIVTQGCEKSRGFHLGGSRGFRCPDSLYGDGHRLRVRAVHPTGRMVCLLPGRSIAGDATTGTDSSRQVGSVGLPSG